MFCGVESEELRMVNVELRMEEMGRFSTFIIPKADRSMEDVIQSATKTAKSHE